MQSFTIDVCYICTIDICYISMVATILKYGRYHTIKWPYLKTHMYIKLWSHDYLIYALHCINSVMTFVIVTLKWLTLINSFIKFTEVTNAQMTMMARVGTQFHPIGLLSKRLSEIYIYSLGFQFKKLFSETTNWWLHTA